MLLLRALSHLWPIRLESGVGPYGPWELAWQNGRLVVNTPHANHSGDSLLRVWRYCSLEPEVKALRPRSILILGFGAGSAATVLRKERRLSCPIVGVDGSAQMLGLARTRFQVDDLAPLELHLSDAFAFAATCTSQHDLVLVDLFHDLDMAPGVEDPAFLADLRRCTAPGGLLCFNTIAHDAGSTVRSERVLHGLRQVFGTVEERRYQGINRVFMAR
ncbi:MAG: methyltransferase domain-containing protein [Flavobacteriales bacterium]